MIKPTSVWPECYSSLLPPRWCVQVTSGPPAAESPVRCDGVTRRQEASFPLLTFPAWAVGAQLVSARQQERRHSRLATCSPAQEEGFTPASHLSYTHSRTRTASQCVSFPLILPRRRAAGSCVRNVATRQVVVGFLTGWWDHIEGALH